MILEKALWSAHRDPGVLIDLMLDKKSSEWQPLDRKGFNVINISLDIQTTSWGLVFFSVCFCWVQITEPQEVRVLGWMSRVKICIHFSEGVVRCVQYLDVFFGVDVLSCWVFLMILDVSNRMGWNANLMGWNPHLPSWPFFRANHVTRPFVSIWQCVGRCAINLLVNHSTIGSWKVLSINPYQDSCFIPLSPDHLPSCPGFVHWHPSGQAPFEPSFQWWMWVNKTSQAERILINWCPFYSRVCNVFNMSLKDSGRNHQWQKDRMMVSQSILFLKGGAVLSHTDIHTHDAGVFLWWQRKMHFEICL